MLEYHYHDDYVSTQWQYAIYRISFQFADEHDSDDSGKDADYYPVNQDEETKDKEN